MKAGQGFVFVWLRLLRGGGNVPDEAGNRPGASKCLLQKAFEPPRLQIRKSGGFTPATELGRSNGGKPRLRPCPSSKTSLESGAPEDVAILAVAGVSSELHVAAAALHL